eukprot:355075-Chlamydomonas_euryale.AAC.1
MQAACYSSDRSRCTPPARSLARGAGSMQGRRFRPSPPPPFPPAGRVNLKHARLGRNFGPGQTMNP